MLLVKKRKKRTGLNKALGYVPVVAGVRAIQKTKANGNVIWKPDEKQEQTVKTVN